MAMLEQALTMIDTEHDNMLALWQDLVNIECGWSCKAGVDAVADRLEGILQELGFKTRQVRFEKAGNMLIGELGDMSKPFVVLTGHMDTVFKEGTAAARPFTIRDGKAYGPGCLDMKGGIVIMLTALKALLANGYTKHPLKVILAGDEEIAHAYSNAAEVFMEESKGALAAFDFETSYEDHSLVIERKGVWDFSVECFGRASHAGNDPKGGRSAIVEIMHKALAISALTDWEKELTVNVGVIEGGTVSNAIPAYAKIICDVRFKNYDLLLDIKQKVAEIAAQQFVPDTKTVVKEIAVFRNMELLPTTQALFETVRRAALSIGLPEPKAKAVGGGSDAAYTTAVGVPTICAMGVEGSRNHTPEEYAIVSSLFDRAKLITKVLLDL